MNKNKKDNKDNKIVIKNLSNENTEKVKNNLITMFSEVYSKPPSIHRRININKINIIYPDDKIKKLDITYLKNVKELLSYYFINISKNPFTDKKYNFYAFEALFIILSIIDKTYGSSYREKKAFYDIKLINDYRNTIKFGKYVFNIPGYKQYIFNVDGFNSATLVVI